MTINKKTPSYYSKILIEKWILKFFDEDTYDFKLYLLLHKLDKKWTFDKNINLWYCQNKSYSKTEQYNSNTDQNTQLFLEFLLKKRYLSEVNNEYRVNDSLIKLLDSKLK
jgi:hypothetical protein